MPFLRKRTASGVTDTLPSSAMDDRERAEQRDAFRRAVIESHADRLNGIERTAALRGDLDSPGLTPIMVRVEEDLRLVGPPGLRDGNPTRGNDEPAARRHLEGSKQGPG